MHGHPRAGNADAEAPGEVIHRDAFVLRILRRHEFRLVHTAAPRSGRQRGQK